MSPSPTWFPSPLLSFALLAMWLVLARSASAGQIAMGLVLGFAVPLLTANLIPERLRLRRPGLVLRYLARVIGDVVVSNLLVGRDVLHWSWRKPTAKFVRVPLELRDPLGLSVLAMVTTIVPGTVWSELAADRSSLLLHVWDVDEVEAFVTRYKARYEQPLREIFP